MTHIDIRAKLYIRQSGKCCYCERPMYRTTANKTKTCRRLGISRKEFDRSLATREHLKRRCEGGGNHPDNLALACQECNTTRGARSWLEFKTIKMGETLEGHYG